MKTETPETGQEPTRSQQIEQLEQALAQHPEKQELRLQLLELYHQEQRVDDFARESRTYRNTERRNDSARELPSTKTLRLQTLLGEDEAVGSQRPRRFGEIEEAREPLVRLTEAYHALIRQPQTRARIDLGLTRHAGRPTPLHHLQRFSPGSGGQIYLKQEASTPAEAHLNILVNGQVLLAQMLDKKRLVTGTIDGRRGLLLSAAAVRAQMQAVVFIDREQADRQTTNLFQMRLMGADVRVVDDRQLHVRDIREAALAEWLTSPDDSFMVIGLDGGPDPYPEIMRELISVIGRETRRQLMGMSRCPPSMVVTRAGDNADALGLFPAFVEDADVRLVCVEMPEPDKPQDVDSDTYNPFKNTLTPQQARLANSILQGTGYPSVAREKAWLQKTGRIEYASSNIVRAERALQDMARLEGIVTPMETANALGWARVAATEMTPEQAIVVMMAERADKDLWAMSRQQHLLHSTRRLAGRG